MPVESATVISELNNAWPLGSHNTNEGDDQLRLIKSVLQAQFPGAAAGGFATPITATEEELNWLTGLTGNVQTQLDALDTRIDTLEATLSAPAGTIMAFYMAAPPPGWTQDATHADAMMRVVSGAGGGSRSGGDSPILNDKIPAHTHPATAIANGAHTHNMQRALTHLSDAYASEIAGNNYTAGITSSAGMLSAGSHDHTVTVDLNAGGSDWEPDYIDMIIAEKD